MLTVINTTNDSRSIALVGYYGKSNFGDDLMQDYLSKILARNNKHKVTVYSDTSHNGVCNGIIDPKTYLSNDVIVFGGGNIVKSTFWPFKKTNFEQLKACNKHIVFLNANVVCSGPEDDLLLKSLSDIHPVWWVRNQYSVNLIKRYGMQAYLLPDIAFHPCIQQSKSKIVSDCKQLSVFTNSYLFNDLINSKTHEAFARILHVSGEITRYLNIMMQDGWKITFYPCQTSRDVDDRFGSSYLYMSLQSRNNAVHIWEPCTVAKIVDTIEQSDLVLSMRFHPTVIAAAHNVPFVDITHDNKNYDLLNDLKLQDQSVLYQEVYVNNLRNATNCALQSDLSNLGLRENAYRRWIEFEEQFDELLQKGTKNNVEQDT